MIRELNEDGTFKDEETMTPTIVQDHHAIETGTASGTGAIIADLSSEGKEKPAETIADQVREALKKVEDPEIHIDVITLNLIYDIKVEGDVCKIVMTFTTPLCPFGPALVEEIRKATVGVPGISKADVTVTFTPAWEPTPEIRMMLGV